MQAANSPSCRANNVKHVKADKGNLIQMILIHTPPGHFRSNTNRTADKKASLVLMNKIPNKFRVGFFGNWLF